MSQAATAHAGVEPAETPLTPDSWGKLGMWIFLAGDAVGFGALLAAYGIMRATKAQARPLSRARDQPHRAHDVLLICSSGHDGESAGSGWARATGTACKKFLFYNRWAAPSS
jgi:heme/copper-type cytochrome/quinol oxidase subunit 3